MKGLSPVFFDQNNILPVGIPENRRLKFAIFLSGSGTNAERLLADKELCSVAEPVVLVTDAPKKSRAEEIAIRYNLPLVASDIREFYRNNGLESISLATDAGRQVRDLWTEELRRELSAYTIDFAVLAGFESLTNITNDFPCINVHPGDLTVTDADGKRLYTGLHSKAVEAALLAGETSLRSTVIIALPFTDAEKDMDNGLILGVSPAMPIGDVGCSLEEMRNIRAARSGKRPADGWQDQLEKIAQKLQTKLKFAGDHVILPLVVRDFALRCFAVYERKLYYRPAGCSEFFPATHEYNDKGERILFDTANRTAPAAAQPVKRLKLIIFALLWLLLAVTGLLLWSLPGLWKKDVQKDFLQPNQQNFRAGNIQAGNFDELLLEDIELGKSTKKLFKASKGVLKLAPAGNRSLGNAAVKTLFLSQVNIVFDPVNMTVNTLTIPELFQTLSNDLPLDKEKRPIPIQAQCRFVTSGTDKENTGQLSIEYNPNNQKIICSCKWNSSTDKNVQGKWSAEIDPATGEINVAISRYIDMDLFKSILKMAGAHPKSLELFKSGKLTGEAKFTITENGTKIRNLDFSGHAVVPAVKFYRYNFAIQNRLDLICRQNGRSLIWQIKSMELKTPATVLLKNIELKQNSFGSRMNFSAACDLRQVALNAICAMFGHAEIPTNSTWDAVSGSWNMRTADWKISGKTAVSAYQSNVAFKSDQLPWLKILPQKIVLAADGKGSIGNISAMSIDFSNLEFKNRSGSFKAGGGTIDFSANFGIKNYFVPDTVKLLFTDVSVSTADFQAVFPDLFAGQIDLKSSAKNKYEMLAAFCGPQGTLITPRGKSTFPQWTFEADMKSINGNGDWNISRFIFNVPEFDLALKDRAVKLENLFIRGSGAMSQCRITEYNATLQTDTLNSGKSVLLKPYLQIDYDQQRKKSEQYKAVFKSQLGILEKPLWGMKKFTSALFRFNSSNLTAIPDSLYIKAEDFQFTWQDADFKLRDCESRLTCQADGALECRTLFSALTAASPHNSFGNGKFSSGDVYWKARCNPQGKLLDLSVIGDLAQPSWSYKSLNAGGENLQLSLNLTDQAKRQLKGEAVIKQASLLSDYFAASTPEIKLQVTARDRFDIDGLINFASGTIASPRGEIELRQAAFTLPWKITADSSAILKKGKLTAEKLIFKQQYVGSLSADLQHIMLQPQSMQQAQKHQLLLQGILKAEKFNKFPVNINTVWDLPPKPSAVNCRLSMAEAKLSAPWQLNNILPLPFKATAAKGSFCFDSEFIYHNGELEQLSGNLNILNSDWQLDSLTLNGTTAALNFRGNASNLTVTPTEVSASELRWKDHLLKNNELTIAVSNQWQLLISGWRAALLDGKLKLAEPFTADLAKMQSQGTLAMKFQLENVSAGMLFAKMNIDFIKSNMQLTGSLHSYLDCSNNKLYIAQARLAGRNPAGALLEIRPASPDSVQFTDKQYRDFALAVLRAMNCTSSVFDLAINPGELKLKITADGTPAKPVPFVYQGRGHRSPFRPADPGEPGFDGELELKINLNLHPEDPGL